VGEPPKNKKKEKEMNLKSVSSILGLAMTALMFTACGSRSGQHAVDNTQPGVTEQQLNHRWTTGCENVNTDVFSLGSQTERYDIGSMFMKVTSYYDESSCTAPLIQVVESGDSQIGTQFPGNVANINIDYSSVSITALNDTGKDTLNTYQACGLTDWVVGQSRDVTAATSTNPQANHCWTKTPRTVFDIVQVIGTQLMFGLNANGLDKTTNDRRPNTIDDGKVLNRL
jgi:hypothetical protein